ncbi:MAG TPA: DNA-3-methyladenine glycosylase I [Chlamydiales bacterium]|nr:DNA-3-methyladenine glycosylase I [Chlamydiales bacterium]
MQKRNELDRCPWCKDDPLYVAYHDEEWGCPLHNDGQLFEFLILEGMQAGLSWLTILRKRSHFREAFAQFDPHRVARFTSADVTKLLGNQGIIRNRLKIESAIHNAKEFLKIQSKYTTFDNYIWQFTDGKPLRNTWVNKADIPCCTEISDKMEKDLKQHGFKFVGSKICYAFMQATGMVNDHLTTCFRHSELH